MRYILTIACFWTMTTSAQTTLEWSFLHPIKKEWMELGTHGSVQEALIASGELPDPFFGKNEEKFGWIEDHLWEFKSLFTVSTAELGKDFVELEFPSLDTYAKVYLNDSLILTTDNAFIPHRVQVKNLLHHGMNELDIIFTPPVIYHADTKARVGYQLPAPNDHHEVAIAPYVRKPQYQFGWDWALRMNTIGLNKPAKVLAYNDNRLIWTSVSTRSIEEDNATLDFSAFLAVPTNGNWTVKSKLHGSMSLTFLEGKAVWTVKQANPNLWWPKGQGDQNLYEDEWTFINEKGKEVCSNSVRYGIRTSELIIEPDEWGTSYFFKINGRRIFAKGGDYIPQEIFPARVTDASVRDIVEQMAAANFNMVRVWGGGYYPDEVFFNSCDELGIMVWEDLMFACAMYPGDSAFLANIEREFRYQVPRIAAHPSVVQFNGNNEVEVAWGNWGFQIKYGLYGKSAKEIETAYSAIFKELAPRVIAEHTSIPYVHTSPLSNWGKPELYDHGSQHYWGVWHGKDPMEDFGKKIGRFNAEYGFQSFPEYSTLLTFSTKDEWDLASEVMKHHQKSYVGNDMILKHAKRLYGTPKNFEEFVYFSQLTQAMAVSMAVAGHRLDAPRCGGTLYWQVNDCWPAPTWSSIDYFGNWKALHYRIKDDYRDLAILEKFDDLQNRRYFLKSDLPFDMQVTGRCKVLDPNGKELADEVFQHTLKTGESLEMNVQKLVPAGTENYLLELSYIDEHGQNIRRIFDHLTTHKRANGRGVEWNIARIDMESKTAWVQIKTTHFLKNAWLNCRVPGVKFDRNFLNLLPGTHTLVVQFETTPAAEDFCLMWQ